MNQIIINVQLHFKGCEKKLTVGNLTVSESFVNVYEIQERFKQRPCFFKLLNPTTTTQFDLTGANDCQLLTFDKDLNFVSIFHYFKHQNEAVSFPISNFYVLLLPKDHSLELENLLCIQLLDVPLIKGIDHVFGTDAEKVEILAKNSHYYFINEYGTAVFPGPYRIKILDDLLAKALKKEDFVLSQRIQEVKKLLLKLPAYQEDASD